MYDKSWKEALGVRVLMSPLASGKVIGRRGSPSRLREQHEHRHRDRRTVKALHTSVNVSKSYNSTRLSAWPWSFPYQDPPCTHIQTG